MFNILTERIKYMLQRDSAARLSNEEFVINEINNFKKAGRRRNMLDGERYFDGKHDILKAKRMMIGEGGVPQEVRNLPNNRIIDNQYRKMIIQKTNYLLGQPITIRTKDKAYAQELKLIFNRRFQLVMRNIGQDSLNCGLGWLFLYYDESGDLQFRRMRPWEIIPGWADDDHTILDYAIRVYDVIIFEGKEEKRVEKVEVYNRDGIHRYILKDGKLKPDEIAHESYFYIGESKIGCNWTKVPMIPFKYNSREIPLINNVKSLQDGINRILSTFANNMEEDPRNTILVLLNYEGEDLGEFRRNLALYGAVKLCTADGVSGDLKTLQVEVNSANYELILECFKKKIIENAMGYDAKDDRIGGNANELNIKSMYSDIDIDANGMETEFQASFESLLWFVNMHLYNTGRGDFERIPLDVIFNRDILISESAVIDDCVKSVGILSDETVVAMHPYVDDPQEEIERIKKQREEQEKQNNPYGDGAFGHTHGGEVDYDEEE